MEISKSMSLTRRQRKILGEIVRKRTCSQTLVQHARIMLLWEEGGTIRGTGKELGVDRNTIRLWRQRWLSNVRAWGKSHRQWSHKVLREKIQEILGDFPRSGAPAKFTAEEVCQIIALACKKPSDVGLPISHWAARSLQEQVLREGIVQEISIRTVGRFLKRQTSSHIKFATT